MCNIIKFERKETNVVKSIDKKYKSWYTTGGTIILGYDDNGKVIGLKNAKEDKEIIVVEVLRGIKLQLIF